MPTDPAFIRADHAIHRRFPMMAPKQRAEIVRDVLNAIREPDMSMIQTAFDGRGHLHPASAWFAMIDAILIQDPEQSASYERYRLKYAAIVGTINSATDEVTLGPLDKQLREEADRQYPTGEEG